MRYTNLTISLKMVFPPHNVLFLLLDIKTHFISGGKATK